MRRVGSSYDYDVIVVGAGAPGEHCAAALAEGGLRVAVVERELVGGECSYWACIPTKTLLRPGEAVAGALDVAAVAQVDVLSALAWRDFMVSDYFDSGQVHWLADRGMRGSGRLDGVGAVEVSDRRYTAEHVVVATGADPVVPPVPGLRELDGIWGTRDATSLKAIPRHLLAREPAHLGEALGKELRRDGIELVLGARATAVRREGEDFVVALNEGHSLRCDRLLVATGRRPRVRDIGLETVGIETGDQAIPVDAHLRAGERLWAIGDVTGLWPLTHVGEYQGDIVAANILGDPRVANYEAVPRVVYTDPEAAAVGAARARFSATASLSEVPKMATYTHAYAESNGFLTLLSDGARLTGAYAIGPDAGEWLQQATLAIRAHIPLDVLRDTIQPFPTFSEIYAAALKVLYRQIATAPEPAGSVHDPQVTPSIGRRYQPSERS